MSVSDAGWPGRHLQTEGLDGIERVRIDCEDVDLRFEVDPALTDLAQLITSGGEKAPELQRDGFDLVVRQRGHYRPGDHAATLVRLPSVNCPPISGGLNKGDAGFHNISAALTLRLGSGDITLERCAGPLHVNLGKGDVRAVSCERSVTISNGSGDVHAEACAGELDIKTGKGDVIVTRPREQLVTIASGNGDVTIEDGSLIGLALRTAKGDVTCTAHLAAVSSGVHGWTDDEPEASAHTIDQIVRQAMRDAMSHSPTKESVARAVEDALSRTNARDLINRLGEFEFEATDEGVRIKRGGEQFFEASDHGLRFGRGDFAFEATDQGVRIKRGAAASASVGVFDIETSGGDIAAHVPFGAPVRVEVLVNSGDVRSDIPLVSVGRPGPRGSTQRLVGGTNPGESERVVLRLRADRGDVRLRSVRHAPPPPPAPPAPPTPPTPTSPEAPTAPIKPANEREERMQAILSTLASGSIDIAEAERLLAALDEQPED